MPGSISTDANWGISSTGPGSTNIQNNYGTTSPYRLTPLPNERAPQFGAHWNGSPSGLLLARNQLVPFTARTQELAELVHWCTNADGPRSAARLLHGPGGQGKTRLVMELANRLPSDWLRWEARMGRGSPDPPIPGAPGQPTLIVVDHAEQWPLNVLRELIEDAAARFPGQLRLLLIARANAGWWSALRDAMRAVALSPDEKPLPPLAGGVVGDRLAVYLAARERFANILEVADHEAAEVPRDLNDERFSLMLTVHTAALVAVHALKRNELSPTDPLELSAYLLDRERNYWEKSHIAGAGRPAVNADEMAQLVFIATLVGRLPYAEACAVLSKTAIETSTAWGVLVKAHALAYPADDQNGFFEPLFPDRLGEDFIALCMPGRPGGQVADPWTTDALDRLLDVPETGASPDWLRHVCVVLVETARRWPHIAQDHLFPLLRRRPWIALAAGGAVLAALPGLPEIDSALLHAIADRFPERDTDLDAGMAAVMLALEPELLSRASTDGEKADIEIKVSGKLFNASQCEEGIRPAQRAVDLYYGLAGEAVEGERALLLVQLAMALDLLGLHLEAVDRHFAALTATQQAARVLLALHGDGSSGNSPWLLSRVLANLAGRDALPPAEQLRIAEKAVEVSKRWVENHHDDWLELPGALDNLALALKRHGRFREAIERTREAVAIRKIQFDRYPKVFGSDLARTLANLGHRLSEIGETKEANQYTREAVALYRGLARESPSEYRFPLLREVWHLAVRLQQKGLSEQSVPLLEEALQGIETLAALGGTYEPWLAEVLHRLGRAYCQQSGRSNEALSVLERCADIRRRLAEKDPETNLHLLVGTLVTLARLHIARSERASALTLLDETDAILQRIRLGGSARYATYLDSIESLAANLRRQSHDDGQRMTETRRQEQ